MFRIFDIEYRRVVADDFATREDAEKRLAELIADDPDAAQTLRILARGEAPLRARQTIQP